MEHIYIILVTVALTVLRLRVLQIVSSSMASVIGTLLHMMPASARNADPVFPM